MSTTELRDRIARHLAKEGNETVLTKILEVLERSANDDQWRMALGQRAAEAEADYQAGRWSSPTEVLDRLLKDIRP